MFPSNQTQIVKLNSSNYSTWVFKMQMLLIKEDLYDVIENNPPDPLTEKWNKRDRQCRALINLFIEDNQIIHIKYESTAKATWNKLKQVHKRSNLSSKLFLLRKLYSLKLEEHGNMQAHINKLLELVDKLKAIGEIIKDNHISALLLCSVPSSYDVLITALEARPESELTPEFVKGKLIDEYNRKVETNSTESKAFKATFKNKSRKEKYCSYCHRNNHSNSECFYLKNKPKQKNAFSHNPPNKSSHCRQDTNSCNLAATKVTQERKTLMCEEKKEKFIALSSYTENETQNFVIDSGCSNHLVNDKRYFSEFEIKSPSSIVIANGSKINTSGMGTVTF